MAVIHFNENAAPRVTELEDGTQVIRTCSSGFGCHNVGCGLKVFVKDGKLVKVEGDPESPITKGRLCIRCLTAKEFVYHKDRLLYPMKRAREDRGKDKWERITWDEAYDMIIENYWKTVEQYGVNAVSVWNGTGREACRYHFQMANDLFGSTTAVHPNSGWSCIMPRNTVMHRVLGGQYMEYDNAIGFPDRYDDPRWVCPKYMMIWGRDQLRSNADGLWGHSTIEMMKRGMKLIVVDPRANWLATRAEIHLQLRPGTDAALALGIINVLIQDDLYDHDFVEKWCYGFDELAARAAEYPLDRVAEITWCDPEGIRAAARAICQKPSTLSMGLAVDQNPNTFQIVSSVLYIFCLCGHIDVPGGIMVGRASTFAAVTDDAAARTDAPKELEGLAKFENFDRPYGAKKWPANADISNNTHPDYTLDVMEGNGGDDVIKFAYIMAHNPVACMPPQSKRWAEGLRGLDFVCVADLVMTPTAMYAADLVLPITSFLERDSIATNNLASQAGQIGAVSKCIEPLGECKSDAQILCDLYQRLYPNGSRPWGSPEEYFTAELAQISGVDFTYPELAERVIGQLEIEYRKYEKGLMRQDGQPGFETPTGRIEFWSTYWNRFGEDPLPYYQEPLYSAISRPDLAVEYPLILTSGARRFTSFHSENRHIKTLREIHEYPHVQINPETAQELGIVDGQWVWIENQLGRCRQIAEVTPIIDPRVVSADHGWWFPERDREDMFGVFDSNVNLLIPHEKHGKLGFGTHYKCMPCKVYPVDPGEPLPKSPFED